MDELNLWLKYPLMVEDAQGDTTTYRGSINIYDEDYKISVTKLKDRSFTIALPTKLILYEAEISSALKDLKGKNIVAVLDTIVTILKSRILSPTLVIHCDAYRHVLYEYLEFTKFYLNLKSCYLTQDLSKIYVSIIDEQSREHSMEISVNFDEKLIFKITESDLPDSREPFKRSSSLKAIYDQFFTVVEALQPFFNLLDMFDTNCWILDPLEPKRKCTYRRICLGENLSVVVTVDPYNVSSIPDMKFLGPEGQVNVYRERLNENLGRWMYENDVFLEILKLLGMESFPQQILCKDRRSDVLKESGDCSICFCLRLNERLPEVICKNKYCENSYHTECLYEWLTSVNARRFFSEVIGQCPNCEKNISCPIPK